MFSTLTERGAIATRMHWRGSKRLPYKPVRPGSDLFRERVREDLIRKIKALCALASRAEALAVFLDPQRVGARVD